MSHYPENYLATFINQNTLRPYPKDGHTTSGTVIKTLEHVVPNSALKTPKQPTDLKTPKQPTGLRNDYYDITLPSGYTVAAMDVIEALDLNFAEGNILKAIWRQATARKGNGKEGTSRKYDLEKVVFFAKRLLGEAK